MTRIVINKPPCPLPLISRPTRKWLPRERWAEKAEEARPAASVAEPRTITDKVMAVFRAAGVKGV